MQTSTAVLYIFSKSGRKSANDVVGVFGASSMPAVSTNHKTDPIAPLTPDLNPHNTPQSCRQQSSTAAQFQLHGQ